MTDVLTAENLPESLRSAEMIDLMLAGVNATAVRVAPCLGSDDVSEARTDEARMVLLGAVKRWTEAGPGGVQQQTAGPFTVSMSQQQQTGYKLWPSEITQLQDICRDPSATKKAFMIDQVPERVPTMADRPDLRFQYGWPGVR